MSLFVDTSALYATMDRDDEFHERASARWKECLSGTEVLVTSNYILVETLALVQSRLGMEATRLLASDVVPALEIQWVSADDHRAALEAVLAANRRSLSFVDCELPGLETPRTAFRLRVRPPFRRAGFSCDAGLSSMGDGICCADLLQL
jgi:predicted nucleic acid-binding protein